MSSMMEQAQADYSEALENIDQAIAFGDYEDLARATEEVTAASAELQRVERQVKAEALNRMAELIRDGECDSEAAR